MTSPPTIRQRMARFFWKRMWREMRVQAKARGCEPWDLIWRWRE